jgi:regulator of protease activity HflC (stomatin/prohibitin superfamily)
MTTIIIVVLVGFLIGIYYLKSLIVVRADEVALKFTFGKITGIYHAGLHVCPWLFSVAVRYERTPLIFEIEVPAVVTKNGRVKGYQNNQEVKRATVNVFLTLTTYFSDVLANLSVTAERVDGNTIEALGPTIFPFIDGVVRSVFSEMPWPLSYQERQKTAEYIMSRISPGYMCYEIKTDTEDNDNNAVRSYYFAEEKLKVGDNKREMERYNPLVQFRLDMEKTSISINEITFSDRRLAESINLAEEARFKMEASLIDLSVVKKEGDAKAYVISAEGKALADSRGLMIKAIKDNPELEYLRALEGLAKGPATKIFYQIPDVIKDKISGFFNDNPKGLQELLKDPEILKVLEDTIKKIGG